MTLTLLKWHWVKIVTYSEVINNLFVKEELHMFLKEKDIEQTLVMNFSSQWSWTCLKTLGQNHDTPSGHGLSLRKVKTSNIPPWERYRTDTITKTDGLTDKRVRDKICIIRKLIWGIREYTANNPAGPSLALFILILLAINCKERKTTTTKWFFFLQRLHYSGQSVLNISHFTISLFYYFLPFENKLALYLNQFKTHIPKDDGYQVRLKFA